MSTVSLYRWGFNRVPTSANPDFLTASIAIFQWLPKASGKGLKKVNACRVCGYMLTRHDMYIKAQQICDRLNAERATALDPPKWLQKTYSVGKPPSLVIIEETNRLPRGAVRLIRERVAKNVLLPACFVRSREGATYVRQRGDQIHLIYFQGMGTSYAIELGFHYAFLPPLFARKKIKLADYGLLDCGLRARSGAFSKPRREKYVEYGTDRELFEEALTQNVKDCLSILELAETRLANPERLLQGTSGKWNRRRIDPWHTLSEEFLPLLALHLGRKETAIKEIERLIAMHPHENWTKHYRLLLQRAKRA
jgi:hypothetical protein